MSAFKYDAVVDPEREDNSHAMLVQMVPPDSRVLDVGCATGYLGKALRERGCSVVGLEPDRAMAQAAAQHLDRVLVGTVEGIDVVGELGPASQDVVVFGDVLEHLVDPAAAIRAVRPLLAPGGVLVASIPNVAHAAVRLSLLLGRFDYTPTGLLDATHVRLFTRRSVLALLDETGFEPVEMRRTTADPFRTEIPLVPEEVPAAALAAALADPDADTYQFLLRARPRDEVTPDERADLLASQQRRLAEHAEYRARRTPVGSGAVVLDDAVHVALVSAADTEDLDEAVVSRVLEAELHRRLPGARLRVLTPTGSTRLTTGMPVEELGWYAPDRVLEGVTAMVRSFAGPDPELDGVSERRWLTAPWSAGPCVDVDWWSLLGLAGRLVADWSPADRLSLLRAAGRVPPEVEAPVVVHGSARGLDRVEAVAAAVAALEEPVVLLEARASDDDSSYLLQLAALLGSGVHALTLDDSLEDLLCLLAEAAVVVTDSPQLAALATAVGTAVCSSSDLLEGRLSSARAGGPASRPPDPGPADALLDRAAAVVAGSASGSVRAMDLTQRWQAVEHAHRMLRRRLVSDVQRLSEALGTAQLATASRLESDEIERLRRELEDVYNTKVMRTLAPARRVYGRLRRAVR